MSEFVYKPKGTCSTKMIFDIEDGTVKSLRVENGCSGNLQGISSLIQGMKIDEVIEKLDGIRCGRKATSCPDRMAQALKQYKIDR